MTCSKLLLPAALVLLCGITASCSSTGPYQDGGLGMRYAGQEAAVEGRAYTPAYKGWRMNHAERHAEKKAISQDMPFSTVRPSAF